MGKILHEDSEIRRLLYSAKELQQALGWIGSDVQFYQREAKKLQEVAGFSAHIFRVASDLLKEGLICLDCSCGKSYISFVLNYLLREMYGLKAAFYGVDTSLPLIERCKAIAALLGYENMSFWRGRTRQFEPPVPVDIVLALHACDIATDEAIAKGIQLGARYIIVVPCCQNQVRGQIKDEQTLRRLTEFGLLRYRFADILTDAIRAQVLRGAGYYVEMHEIVPPTVTPKNLVITARKTRSGKKGMEGYKELSRLFGVHSPIEGLLQELFGGDKD
ncbi:MAG TPA: class I SAM-dependent methyltransferase [Candidatus Hypogeohydataceae bacterium YC40]